MTRILIFPAGVSLVLVLLCSAQVHAGNVPAKMDLVQLKRESELFEDIINTSIRQAISNPMLLAEKSRGTYLENYGAVFSLTVNLSRSLIIFPSIIKRPKGAPATEMSPDKMMALLRGSLAEILGQYGDTLKQLSSDSRISIIAHVLSQSDINGTMVSQVLVITALKVDVEQLQREKITFEDFRKRIRYVEY